MKNILNKYKVENPHIKSNIKRIFHVFLCKEFGHITHGAYYGMAQSHCRRCGIKLSSAYKGYKEFVKPWNEYEQKD